MKKENVQTQAQNKGNGNGFKKIFIGCLKDIYYAEKHLPAAMTKMIKAAEDPELKKAIEEHKQETEGQIAKLEEVFRLLDMRPSGKKCPAIEGLISEAAQNLEDYEKGPAKDALIIVDAQKIEHYEMAAYGSLKTFADTLGYSACRDIFDTILQQESSADKKLTNISRTINQHALQEV